MERDVTLAGEIALECDALDVVLATDEAKRRLLWDVRRGIGEAAFDLFPHQVDSSQVVQTGQRGLQHAALAVIQFVGRPAELRDPGDQPAGLFGDRELQ